MNAKLGKLKKTIWKSYGITFLVSEVLFLVGAYTRETWEPGMVLCEVCLAVQFIGLLAVLVIILSLSIAEHIARRKAPAKRTPNRPAVRRQEPRPPKVTEETRAKWEKESREAREALRADISAQLSGTSYADEMQKKEWEKQRKEWDEAREALKTDISAQLSGTSYADEILKVLDIRPNSVHFWHSGANLKQENDGTWSLTRYYNHISKCWDQETGLAQQDAIGKLIAFVQDWQAGNYPQGSFNAMKERYKNDEIGMGKLLFECYSTICISEIAVPACLNVYKQMAGIHDESETCIDLFDANGNKVESLSIREPETYVISGERKTADELVIAYLKKDLNIPDK